MRNRVSQSSAIFPGADKLSGFRHNGGWLEDVDGDGWQDVNLPFLRYILVISCRTGAQLALLHPEIAKRARDGAPVEFNSGPFHGSFTPFTASDGKRDVLIASANPVGSFDDIYCNVARYYAVLETKTPNQPRTRELRWADYISFVKNFFSGADAQTIVRPMKESINAYTVFPTRYSGQRISCSPCITNSSAIRRLIRELV